MAEEPQPSQVQEGADPPDALPANAEDRKAAKAMSSLDTRGEDEAAAAPKKEVDVKALTDAMNMLQSGTGQQQKAVDVGKKKEDVKKPLVKVDQADVALLVEHLDLTKGKATDLLRAHDADAGKAMQAWVTASV